MKTTERINVQKGLRADADRALAKTEVYDDAPEWKEEKEKDPRAGCSACDRPIFTDATGFTHKGTVRLQRGRFAIPDKDGEFTTDQLEGENLKFEHYICEQCWLSDPDLCRFFNKIGMRVR